MGLGITADGATWEFRPKDDITAIELAECLAIVIEGLFTAKGQRDAEFGERLIAVKRHFRIRPDEMEAK